MRVLITGSTGQVGTALCRRLGTGGGPIEVLDDRRLSVRLDLTDPASIISALEEARPDLVINAAAYTAVDRAEDEPSLAFAVNAEGAGVLAEESARLEIPLIHYSTDYVFSGEGTRPWRESDPTGPLNIYGASKLQGEQNIIAAHSGAIILRTSWVFSPTGSNFVKTMLRLGRERETLTVIDDQVGAPTSAAFLAEMTAGVLKAGPDPATAVREHAGLFHLCCAGETSWRGFAEEIFRQAGARPVDAQPAHAQPRHAQAGDSAGGRMRVTKVQPVSTAEYPTRARRPLNSRLNCGRFFAAFPLPRRSWEEALAEVMEELGNRASSSLI